MACKSYLSFLLAALFVMNVCCFVSNGPTHHQASSARKQARTAIKMMESRRNFLVQAGLSTGLLVNTMKSDAKVYFEIDKYGDKELKIGTVNKLNQNLRNAMGKDPTLIPAFFRLALYDGLNYVAASNLGGLDGKLDPRLRELDPAAGRALGEALAIKARLQRTNELSLADVIAFGGAQAIECVGGPKIVVQLGRTDNQKVQESRPLAALGTADFQRSGLGAREGVLLLAALGELELLAEKEVARRAEEEDEEEDCGIDGCDGTSAIPDTFGGQREIYGSLIGQTKFGTTFLDGTVKGKIATPLAKAIMNDELMNGFAKKYQLGSKGAFVKDVNEAYGKFSLLGADYINRNSS
mmetsp:Transcript_21971/g.30187  ORF Transcript_21971/g.30187 Transcript_21971/m.30187 type:complete len:353 (-) Transcript_21971:195-1253(-)